MTVIIWEEYDGKRKKDEGIRAAYIHRTEIILTNPASETSVHSSNDTHD